MSRDRSRESIKIPTNLVARRELKAKVETGNLDLLVDAVRELSQARTLEQVSDIVRRAARELTSADGATFVLRDGGMCWYVDEDAISPLWRGKRFPIETCISGTAMLERSVVIVPDIYADDRIPHDAYRPTFVKSLVMVPIRTAEPWGAIGNYWAHSHVATPTEVRLLQALADSTSVAMERIKVLDELESRISERTSELTVANRKLDEFASIAAHDLRSPLASIVGFADLLSNGPALTDDDRKLASDGILMAAGRMSNLVDGLLDFARAGGAPGREPVDLAALVADVLDELNGDLSARSAQVVVEPLPVIEGDRLLLAQALRNLVANAVRYVRVGRVPEVRIFAVITDGSVEVVVADNGPGIDPAERERVVAPLRRGSTSAGSEGTGLGLSICSRVAAHHDGRLVIRDGRPHGAEIALVLPAERLARTAG